MIKAGAIDKGMFLLFKDEPYQVTDREFVNPGKGSAFVRLKLKNVRTGLVNRPTMKSHDNVKDIPVEQREAQYLYREGESFMFMDSQTFDQFGVARELVGSGKYYLKEGVAYQLLIWEGTPLQIQIPLKTTLSISQAETGEKGDSATGSTKNAVTDTGLTVKVPLFIKEGDRIVVKTDSGEYVERASG